MISTLPRMFPRENSRLTRHRQLYCVVNKLNATNAMSGDDKSRHLVARTPSPQKHTTATTKIAVNSGKLSAGMLKTASLTPFVFRTSGEECYIYGFLNFRILGVSVVDTGVGHV